VFSSDYFDNKRVLVAGAAGFVGTHLVKRLVGVGANVRGTLFNRPPQHQENSVEYIYADLTQPAECRRAMQDIDFVFMAAANSSGAAVIEKTPLVHLTPNVIMNAQMLAAAYENNVKKFCFISSNTVYPAVDFPVKEDDVNNEFFEKYFVVGWMKRFSEVMCEMYSTKISSPMSSLVVRPANLYGPYDKFTRHESKVIAALLRRAVERANPFKVWGDGRDVKDFLYVEDFVDGLLSVFARTDGFEQINIGSGEPVTIRDVLAVILNAAQYKDVSIQFDSGQPTMIPKRLIDISKIKRLTGWSPSTSLEEGMAKTVSWYRETFQHGPPD